MIRIYFELIALYTKMQSLKGIALEMRLYFNFLQDFLEKALAYFLEELMEEY